MKETIDYYNENAQTFAEGTVSVDFSEIQNQFCKRLPSKAHILDFGCGSGRDTKYFLEQGFQVDAVDGSETLCKLASEYTGIVVKHMLFQELNVKDQYDGIWACASILHLKKKEIPEIICKMYSALRKNGIFYMSFKYGDFEGTRNGRYFTDLTEESALELLQDVPELKVEKQWITGDVRSGRGDERWLNMILRK
ncbi:class I SAM-dependent methyltransferase [Anaerostipes faecalis]|uniref:class I SAM-dependent methyltransferase n=1 Tax=Anaerostipes faecalis TaxID=2738446 RepID=UPI002A77A7C2|nr:class I SAM-dependent methyltransferase [Anaerostipes faecalis]